MRFLDGTRRIPDSSTSTAGSFGLSCEAAVLLSILEARDSSCPVEGTESGYTCSVFVVLHAGYVLHTGYLLLTDKQRR